jgi:hypothetical protein
MRKSLTWAVIGTAVAAGALSVAGMAGAGATAVKATSLSITKSVSTIKAGDAVTISGTLRSGTRAVGQQGVYLDVVGSAGKLRAIAEGTTNRSTGVVRFAEHPAATTTYELVFKGAAGYAGSHSGTAKVTVVKRETALALAESVTTPVQVGTTVTLTGTLTSAGTVLGNRLVLLDTVDPKGGLDWTHRSASTNSKTGIVTFAVKPGATTTYRLVFPGNWQYEAAVSAPAKVVVTKIPATLTVTAAAGGKAGTKVLTGTLTAGMTDLAGETVSLAAENSTGQFVILRSNVTLANGTVTFTVDPSKTTTYELVFTGTAVYAHATSGTVTVTV